MVKIPDTDDPRMLRHVEVDGYRLMMWDTYRVGPHHKSILGYAFFAPGATEPLFSGEDFGAPACRAIDSDRVVRCLLGFLTLRPGDTDRDYFDDYTPEQMAFAMGPALDLQIWATEPDGDWNPPAFVNLDDWVD